MFARCASIPRTRDLFSCSCAHSFASTQSARVVVVSLRSRVGTLHGSRAVVLHPSSSRSSSSSSSSASRRASRAHLDDDERSPELIERETHRASRRTAHSRPRPRVIHPSSRPSVIDDRSMPRSNKNKHHTTRECVQKDEMPYVRLGSTDRPIDRRKSSEDIPKISVDRWSSRGGRG